MRACNDGIAMTVERRIESAKLRHRLLSGIDRIGVATVQWTCPMRRLILPLAFLCCTVCAPAQEERSTPAKLDGCYEVISLSWSTARREHQIDPATVQTDGRWARRPIQERNKDMWLMDRSSKEIEVAVRMSGRIRGHAKAVGPWGVPWQVEGIF